MFLADLHIHSTFSDGKLSIPELVDFYGCRGFGAIAITDHLCEDGTWLGGAARWLQRTLTPATFPLYLNILRSEADRAWREYRMVLLPGVELTRNRISNRRSAHLLGIGIHEYIDADADTVTLCRRIRAQGAIVVAAHPVHTKKMEKQTYHLWDRRDELVGEIDAWEVASGPHLFEEVLRSGLPMVASSDLHRPDHIHSWKTVFQGERDRDAVLQAVRDQELSFQFYAADPTDLRVRRLPVRAASAGNFRPL